MPETAMYENGNPPARENDIGLPRQSFVMEPVTKSSRVKESADVKLWLCVLMPDKRHLSAAGWINPHNGLIGGQVGDDGGRDRVIVHQFGGCHRRVLNERAQEAPYNPHATAKGRVRREMLPNPAGDNLG